MFIMPDHKMWASHLLVEKAERNAATDYPGAAIDNYRNAGMNECEQMLPEEFSSYSLADKLIVIDRAQQQARRRIYTNRQVQAGRVPEVTYSRRALARLVHEDEGRIMGLERLWCILSGVYPTYGWEAAIEGNQRPVDYL